MAHPEVHKFQGAQFHKFQGAQYQQYQSPGVPQNPQQDGNKSYPSTICLVASLEGTFAGMGIALVNTVNLIPRLLKNLFHICSRGLNETIRNQEWRKNHSITLIFTSYNKSATEAVTRDYDAKPNPIEHNKFLINLLHFVGILASAVVCNYFFPVIAVSLLVTLIIVLSSTVFVKLITKPNVPRISGAEITTAQSTGNVMKQLFGGVGNYLGLFLLPKTIMILMQSNFFSVLLNLLLQLSLVIGSIVGGAVVILLLVWFVVYILQPTS